MRLIEVLAAAGMFSAANAWGQTGTGAYTTTVVTTDYTTYCSSPTTFAYHNVTYTATSETVITITNCPCTFSVTQPPPVTTTSYCPPSSVATGTGSLPTYANSSTTVITYTPPPTTYLSGTTPITATLSTSTPRTPVGPTTVISSPVIVPTAAAGKVGPAGALLAVGLAALAL
ncbi:uncharacterized protein BCR38DRAFT_404702 [Pseudomassariella vexata]|uniref:Mmc protein n=1 Tax=Pseudomassariella vexata TaxID=1141098 RepID=A0A1Y2EJA6_9PEZI|nr:uncharacterized protein BCR38DRAFT_404702 [Pseudomassariella vexata]ORY71640.1 hypothetical protein BCR38DRAFT_404702 [Pseudomassariella vexata]